MAIYYVFLNSEVKGPYTGKEVYEMYSRNEIDQNTLVEPVGESEWKAFKRIPQFINRDFSQKELLEGEFVRYEGEKIVFYCPGCRTKYRALPEEIKENRAYCEKCNVMIKVPQDGKPKEAPAEANEQAETLVTPNCDEYEEIPAGECVCPHCWNSFDEEHLMYIAVHPALVGDPIVGEFEHKRFVPKVFNTIGQALDEMGVPTSEMACPHCHLRYPRGMLDSPSVYLSIAGATASGKSYFLTCQCHELRRVLKQHFGISFFDSDPRMNETLSRYENQLFAPLEPNKVTALPATQLSGEGISDCIRMNDVDIELPKPFVFDYQPSGEATARRNLVFYDNSGELFTPGRDGWVNQATRHLKHANGITFLYDPASDSRMRLSICNPEDPQITRHPRVVDQERLLDEMIYRLRSYRNMSGTAKCDIPLVVAVCKYDLWQEHFPVQLESPYIMDGEQTFVNMNHILNVSYALRRLMKRYAPGMVNAAESFFKRVYFVPVSSFGTLAEEDSNGYIGVVSEKIKPIWIEVPFLLQMVENKQLEGKIQLPKGVPEPIFTCRFTEDKVRFKEPETGEIDELPLNYAGMRLSCGGKFYDIPKAYKAPQKKESTSVWE